MLGEEFVVKHKGRCSDLVFDVLSGSQDVGFQMWQFQGSG